MDDALNALWSVAETGSVTAAAGRRHVTQPAMTRQLQRLAEEVGVPLLRRQGRGVVLTPAGLALVEYARRRRAEWASALAAVRGASWPLRLSCGTTVALTLLPAALALLRAAEPRLALHLRAGDSAVTAARLLAGEVDAGVVTTAPADGRLQALPLLADPVVCVGPPQAPARLTLSEVAGQPLCLYARGTGFRAFVDELFGRQGLFPDAAAEMDSLEALREMVAAGLGLSLLPRSVVAPSLAAGLVDVIDVPELRGAERTIALAWRRDEPPHAAMGALKQALRTAAATLAAMGTG